MTANWTVELIQGLRRKVRARRGGFTYAINSVYQALGAYGTLAVAGRRGLVIGSETPWLEAFLLQHGAQHVSTLEFGAIRSSHPQISTFTPKDFTEKFLQVRNKQQRLLSQPMVAYIAHVYHNQYFPKRNWW